MYNSQYYLMKIFMRKQKTITRKTAEQNDSLHASKEGIQDILRTVNRGFDDIQKQLDRQFAEISETLSGHTTILDGHTKILERLDGERIFTEHSIQRLEKEMANIKKQFHLS